MTRTVVNGLVVEVVDPDKVPREFLMAEIVIDMALLRCAVRDGKEIPGVVVRKIDVGESFALTDFL